MPLALQAAVIGLLAGYVLTALGTPLLESTRIFGEREPPEARRYIISRLENDPETLIALSPARDVVARAMLYKRAAAGRGTVTPVSVTYIGGRGSGHSGIHMYALGLRSSEQGEGVVTMVLTFDGGKVVRID